MENQTLNISISERLAESIKNYVSSHQKKYNTIFLADYNLDDKIIAGHKKYAAVKSDEKVLMAVNKIILYPFSGMGILITDRFLYYRLVDGNSNAVPIISLFKGKPTGIIPLSSIKNIKIGDSIMTLGGQYYGDEFFVNGKRLGLLPFTGFAQDGMKDELRQIFKVFDNE